MAVPVAAIVKKVAVALLGSDKKTRDGIGTMIGVVLLVPCVPIIALIMALSGGLDSDALTTNAQGIFDIRAGAYIIVIDSNLSGIESSMTEAGFTEIEINSAKEIYKILFLRYGDQENFVSNFVGCFSSGQSAADLTCNLNSTFGTSVEQSKVEAIINTQSSNYIDVSGYYDTSIRNNLDLCRWAQMAYDNNWGYVWGTYGNIMTRSSLESLSETYPTQVGADEFHDYIEANYIGRHCVDCAGLIKSYMWYDFNSGSFVYGSNDFADGNTEYIYTHSPETGTIDTLPDTPGIGVYHKGHVGIYIGNGIVIEAMGTTYGMQCRSVSEGSWTNWFVIPGLTYVDPEAESTEETEQTEATEPSETTTNEEENTDG